MVFLPRWQAILNLCRAWNTASKRLEAEYHHQAESESQPPSDYGGQQKQAENESQVTNNYGAGGRF
jgi:hypothetical protein